MACKVLVVDSKLVEKWSVFVIWSKDCLHNGQPQPENLTEGGKLHVALCDSPTKAPDCMLRTATTRQKAADCMWRTATTRQKAADCMWRTATARPRHQTACSALRQPDRRQQTACCALRQPDSRQQTACCKFIPKVQKTRCKVLNMMCFFLRYEWQGW